MSEHVRTGVQRRALIGAGVGLLALGAVGAGFVVGGEDGPSGQRISDVQTTTTEATTTTVLVTTTEAPTTTVVTTTAPPTTEAPIEQRVDVLEDRVDQIEATTTTQPSRTVTTSAPPPSPCAPEDVDGCKS